MRVLVVSGDRDTIQLVNDDVTLLYPRKGVSDLVEYTPEAVFERYAVAPHQYPDIAALVGETSDNLPGVPGVGPLDGSLNNSSMYFIEVPLVVVVAETTNGLNQFGHRYGRFPEELRLGATGGSHVSLVR